MYGSTIVVFILYEYRYNIIETSILYYAYVLVSAVASPRVA
jgi:hypothetical protein